MNLGGLLRQLPPFIVIDGERYFLHLAETADSTWNCGYISWTSYEIPWPYMGEGQSPEAATLQLLSSIRLGQLMEQPAGPAEDITKEES